MKNKESFHNEVSIRLESKFDSRCVMDMFDSFDYDNDKSSRNVSMWRDILIIRTQCQWETGTLMKSLLMESLLMKRISILSSLMW